MDLDSIFSDPDFVKSLNEEYETTIPKRTMTSQRKSNRGSNKNNMRDDNQKSTSSKILGTNTSYWPSPDQIRSDPRDASSIDISFGGICIILLLLTIIFLLAIIFLLRASYYNHNSAPPRILTHTVTDYSFVTIEPKSTEKRATATSTITSTHWRDAETVTNTEVEYVTSSFTETVTSTITSTETTTETSTKTSATNVLGKNDPSVMQGVNMNSKSEDLFEFANLALNARVLSNYTTISDVAEKILNPVDISNCWVVGEDAVIGVELESESYVRSIVVHTDSPEITNMHMTLYNLKFRAVKSAVGLVLDLNMPLRSFMLRLKGNHNLFCVNSIEIRS